MSATIAGFVNIMSAARRRRRRRAAWVDGLLLALLWLGQHTAVAADAPVSREYQIKAAFLYNILKFVEWPAGSFVDANATIVIGVLGPSPISDELQTIVKGRTISGRSLVVSQVETVEAAKASHLLFVSDGASQKFRQWRNELADSAVLTVGESAAFAAAGGSIRFVPKGDKLSFEINMYSAERARLKISSQLQKLATAVSRAP